MYAIAIRSRHSYLDNVLSVGDIGCVNTSVQHAINTRRAIPDGAAAIPSSSYPAVTGHSLRPADYTLSTDQDSER